MTIYRGAGLVERYVSSWRPFHQGFIFYIFYLVLVPFRTSHMEHLNASALFLKVHTEQSQKEAPAPSTASGEWGPPAGTVVPEELAPDPDAAAAPPLALLLRLNQRLLSLYPFFIQCVDYVRLPFRRLFVHV